jgi:hypothetical protein
MRKQQPPWTCPVCHTTFRQKGGHAKVCGTDRGEIVFWSKVDKGPHPGGCWLYMGFRKWDGYGWLARSWDGGKRRYLTAHRYAWILTHGEPPQGAHILHQCDNPPCCNPSHLRLGTHQENMADQVSKRRHVYGERSGRNKLTREQVEETRRIRPRGTKAKAELAARFGVALPTIEAVLSGRSWKIDLPAKTLHPGRVRPRRQA